MDEIDEVLCCLGWFAAREEATSPSARGCVTERVPYLRQM